MKNEKNNEMLKNTKKSKNLEKSDVISNEEG